MSASAELQRAVLAALVADAAVQSHVAGRVYDMPPTAVEFPHVSFGPSQEIEADAECIDGEEHFLQLDVWDRSHGRLNPVKRIVSAVKAALHRAELSLPDPYALASIRVTQTRAMLDADGLTAHGIVTVRAEVEL